MTICPTIAHLMHGREEVLQHVSSLTQLQSNKEYIYKLNHYYDAAPSDVYVSSTIEPAAFELLVAFILYSADDIQECCELCQDVIADSILCRIYNVDVLEDAATYDQHFDLYVVWEKWCSYYDDIKTLKVLQHTQLHEELVRIIPTEQ